MNGSQLILVSGTYGANGSTYRTELDTFAKIEAMGNGSVNHNGGRAPSGWKVWSKDGKVFYYGTVDPGQSNSAQNRLPGTNSIHRWNLARMEDRSGNYYEVHYYSGNGRPNKILYTLKNGISTGQEIKFNYQSTRPDPRHVYVAGKRIDHTQRLKNINIKNAGQAFRQYHMVYEQAPVTGRSRLTAIRECGVNGSTCFPDIKIKWQANQAGYRNATAAEDKAPDNMIAYYTYTKHLGGGQVEHNSVKEINRGEWVDLNGDGEADQVIAYVAPGGNYVRKVYLRDHSRPSGWSTDQGRWHLPKPLRSYTNAVVNTTTARFGSGVINMGQFADVNGDGLVDIVYSYRLDRARQQYADPNNPISQIEDFRHTYLNTGNGWQLSAVWKPKDLLYDYVSNGAGYYRVETVRGRLLDINGDGLVDWVRAYFDYIANNTGRPFRNTWINDGSGWNHHVGYKLPDVFAHYRGIYSIPHGQFVDVNGDGLPDWVQSYHASTETPQRKTWVNTGSGWSRQSRFDLPDLMYDNLGGWNDVTPNKRGSFVDINGDGLRDWVESYETGGGFQRRGIRLNTGNGWGGRNVGFAAPPFAHVDFRYSNFGHGYPINKRGEYLDLNGDGLMDYVESYKSSATGFPTSRKAYINVGNRWQLQAANSVYTPRVLYYDYSGRRNAKSKIGQFVDINADGSADWVASRSDITNYSRLKRQHVMDQVASITSTMGVEVKPTLLPLTHNDIIYQKRPNQMANGQPAPLTNHARFVESPMYVTSKLLTSRPDSNTEYNTTKYRYGGLQVHRLGRGALGFFRFETIDSLGVSTVQEFKQVFPLVGQVKQVRQRKSGRILSDQKNNYKVEATHRKLGKTYFAALQQTTRDDNEFSANQTYRKTVQQRQFEPYGQGAGDYGNLSSVKTQTYGVRNGQSTLLHTILFDPSYDPADTNNWLINRLQSVSVTTTQSNATGQSADQETLVTEFDYDSKGRITRMVRQPNDAPAENTTLTTQFTYHPSYGVLTQQSIMSGSETRSNFIGYDADYRLPNTFTNALGHRAQITAYHPVCELPTLIKDANALQTQIDYDNFCRQTSITEPTGITQTVSYSEPPTDCVDCQSEPQLMITESTPNSQSQDVIYFLNRYGQTIRSQTKGKTDQHIWQYTHYTRFGQIKSQTQPFYQQGVDDFTTHYAYDDLNRLIQVRLPFDDVNQNPETVEHDFGIDAATGWLRHASIDPEDKLTITYLNALGHVMRVTNELGHSMHYAYDAHGNLVQTKDAGVAGNGLNANITSISYDQLGRRISLQDPDLGTTNYRYSAFDELLSQTDAKGNVQSMRYDPLGRLIERQVAGTNGRSSYAQWIYDSVNASNDSSFAGVGALHKVMSNLSSPGNPASANHVKEYNYDAVGRLVEDLTYFEGEVYQQQYSYTHADGFLETRQYPTVIDINNQKQPISTPFKLKYKYDNGYLALVVSVDESDPQNYVEQDQWSIDRYDAQGRVITETLGDVVKSQSQYKAGMGALERIVSTVVRGNNLDLVVQDIGYTFDGVGNVTSRSGYLNGISEHFNYDALHRLTRYSHSGIDARPAVDLTYDAIGNITHKSDVGTYIYDNTQAGPHALTRIIDPPGADSRHHFDVSWAWQADSMPHPDPGFDSGLYSSGPGNHVFTYDANGNMIQNGQRNISWTAFDKPRRLVRETTEGFVGSQFSYDGHFNRIKKVESVYSPSMIVLENKEETFYIGKDYEKITNPANQSVLHRYTLNLGQHMIQVERAGDAGNDQPHYMLADNQGSIHVVLNSAGELKQTLNFDPWGKRLQTAPSELPVNQITNRGYTGHEMDDELGLVNMNARIYDPAIGRFLSADPVLPDAFNMQQYNRYSYVTNNPMSFTDPSGNFGVGLTTICQSSNGGESYSCTGFPTSGTVLWPGKPFDADIVIGKAEEDYYEGSITQEQLLGTVIAATHSTLTPYSPVDASGDDTDDSPILPGDTNEDGEISNGEALVIIWDVIAENWRWILNDTFKRTREQFPETEILIDFSGLEDGKDVIIATADGDFSGAAEHGVGILANKVPGGKVAKDKIKDVIEGKTPDYSTIKNPPNVGEGKDFTARQKREAIELNKQANGGVVRSDQSGEILVQPQKSMKGVTPPDNEWQIDHKQAKNCGGTNCSSNIQILSRKENRDKSDG